MKKIINILISTAVTVFAISCNRYEMEMPIEYDDRIEISFSSAATKVADTDVESYINHVDILVFNHNGTRPTTAVHYERISVAGAASSVLQAKRSSFTSRSGYYVQVVANSTASESTFRAIADYSDLENMMQEDVELHLTALNIGGAPKYFLMDGVAYIGSTKPSGPGIVVLNDGVASNSTELKVNLTRAAAKIEVFVAAGDNSEFEINFKDGLAGSSGANYHFRNLPYDTFVIDHDPTAYTKLVTTSPTRSGYFIWNPAASPKNASIIVYAYAHNWKHQSLLESEPCIVVNLPFTYTDKTNSTVTDYPNSWYKIPMSADDVFDRNMYYKVEIVINRPGATSMFEPVELGPISYNVADWTPVEVNISDSNRPKYLAVNRNSMEMFNVALDNTTLEFSSSSAVTITVSDAYYIDKFGGKVAVSTSGITATAAGLSGFVVINSPLPTINTVLYFTLTLTNADGETETVTVKQYPLVYVENILSWYSYRDDFKGNGATEPTTYKNISSRNNVIGIAYENGVYSYNTSIGYYDDSFFGSKVNRKTYPSTDTDSKKGRSDIDRYYWDKSLKYSGYQDPGNARMYHITIMASSGDYTVGRPKITEGITDPGEDNAKLVSPSFMIASRLAVFTTSAINLSA